MKILKKLVDNIKILDENVNRLKFLNSELRYLLKIKDKPNEKSIKDSCRVVNICNLP